MKICLEFLKNLEDLLSSKFILSSSGEEINMTCFVFPELYGIN